MSTVKDPTVIPFQWPHAPVHHLHECGMYMVTAATYQKTHFFRGSKRLDFLMGLLFRIAVEKSWELQAWAKFPNHYHIIAKSPADPQSLKGFIGKLHMLTAKEMNRLDGKPGRKVWHQYWDSRITFQRSYFARLKYVHQNPVHHGVCPIAENYHWCSAAWFQRTAETALKKTLSEFKIDQLDLPDLF